MFVEFHFCEHLLHHWSCADTHSRIFHISSVSSMFTKHYMLLEIKVIIGIFIHLARYIVLITLFTVTHHKYMNSFSTTVNSTVQCLFINDTDFLRYIHY